MRLRPSFFDLIFVSLPFWFFALGQGGILLLLSDGDTGWHIRTGDVILATKRFIYADPFSFSRPGGPWFAWEWLTDVLYSQLMTAMGLKGILLLSILLTALYSGLTFRHLVWRGANVFIALPLTLIGFTASTVHILARPHLWTMFFVVLSLWLIEADLKQPRSRIWFLVPLTALWTNLHGGWLALPSLLLLVALGLVLERFFGSPRPAGPGRYVALAAACLGASLLNPYGYHLHLHTARYLSLSWIRDLVSEFRSPVFRGEEMLQLEFLLFVSAGAAMLKILRKEFVGPLIVLFWLHSALVSARHITIFVAAALPYVSDELMRLWDQWTNRAQRGSTAGVLNGLAQEARAGIRRTTFWSVLPFVLVASPVLKISWPDDLPALRFPTKMVAKHQQLLIESRVFTEDQWADYLIFRSAPQQRVFFDGRSDFYGKQIADDYLRVLTGDFRWRQILDRYRIDAVLLKPVWAAATLLKSAPEWRLVDDDGQAVLFVRRGSPASRVLGKTVKEANEKP